MSNAILKVIYGYPMPVELDRILDERETDLDKEVYQIVDELGFTRTYVPDGSFSGYFGISLMKDVYHRYSDATEEDEDAPIGSDLWAGESVSFDKYVQSVRDPTEEEKAQVQERFEKLPAHIKRLCAPLGRYIVWGWS